MDLNNFIHRYGIKPADAIVAKKLQFGLLKHYIIYLGFIEGEHRFMANYTRGIHLISTEELSKLLGTYTPIQLNRFDGNEFERRKALERAWSRRGEQEYDLILNNCEHYKSFVHHGQPSSHQVNTFGVGMVATGAAIALGSASEKNERGTIGGLILAGLGLVTLILENEKSK